MSAQPPTLRACHECGLIHRLGNPADREAYLCSRCGADLLFLDSEGNGRALAYTATSLILLLLAATFPLMSIEIQGQHNATSMVDAAISLWQQGDFVLAGIVALTTMVIPGAELGLLLYLLLPLSDTRRHGNRAHVLRNFLDLRPWGMVGVFMLGMLVCLVKLGSYADVVVGVAFWSLSALLVMQALIAASFRPDSLWQAMPVGRPSERSDAARVPASPGSPPVLSRAAARAGRYACCHVCSLLVQLPSAGSASEAPADQDTRCPRCGAPVHHRQRDSLNRCLALLVAAMILYVPANVLPIMNTGSILGTQADTIMSGVVFFWSTGSWPLALLVFFASIVVPLLKMIALLLLVTTSARRSTWRMLQRTRLYRVVEFIGRWSMLDIYVIAIMTAVVQMGSLASITPGPAAIAFGCVVVLTMLASMQFDPRLIWDPVGERDGPTA